MSKQYSITIKRASGTGDLKSPAPLEETVVFENKDGVKYNVYFNGEGGITVQKETGEQVPILTLTPNGCDRIGLK